MNLQAGSRDREQPLGPLLAEATGITAYLKHLWGLRASRYASRPSSGTPSAPDDAPVTEPRSEQAVGLTERVVVGAEESLRSAVLAPGRGHCFEGRRFDCVVDTFGLCSCKDPVRALQEMLKVRPSPTTRSPSLHQQAAGAPTRGPRLRTTHRTSERRQRSRGRPWQVPERCDTSRPLPMTTLTLLQDAVSKQRVHTVTYHLCCWRR